MKIDIGSQSHLKKPMVGGDSLKMNEFNAHIAHLHNERKKERKKNVIFGKLSVIIPGSNECACISISYLCFH